MGITVATTRVACDTGGGNQDITTADMGGLTPKAALFIVTSCITDATPAVDYVLCVGAATSTTKRWAVNGTSEDSVGAPNTFRRAVADECIQIMVPNTGGIDGEADFVAFIENGVRINWGDAPAAEYLLTVVLFAGTDLSALADTIAVDVAEDATEDIATVGFEPDQLILVSNGSSAGFNDVAQVYNTISVGVADNDGSDTQGAVCLSDTDGGGTTELALVASDDYAVINTSKWGTGNRLEVGTFDANGFSLTARLGAVDFSVGYLALYYNSAVDHWVGPVDTPTSTGNDAQTGPGFTPQFVMEILSHAQAYDTHYTDGDAGAMGVSVFDADDEYCNACASEDGQGTSDTQSLSDDTAVNFPDDDGTAGFVASFVSFDANGWTLNFSTTDGTARKLVALAIETAQPERIPRPSAAYNELLIY